MESRKYKVYTDGAQSSKLEKGGWAFLAVDDQGSEHEESGVLLATTNNQMELLAVIRALQWFHTYKSPETDEIQILSDSKYVVLGITEWIHSWKGNNWRGRAGPVKNREFWEVLDVLRQNIQVSFNWVKGHAGEQYNERVDKLAKAQAHR